VRPPPRPRHQQARSLHDSHSLVADTDYDVEITVRNSSRTKAALSTQVHARWVEFGAGGQQRHPIASVPTDVPVWPGTSSEVVVWRTPATPGHYCIEVELAHPDDGNPANNRGWNNTLVRTASSPVVQEIEVFNMHPKGCPPVREGGTGHVKPHRVLLGWAILGAFGGIFGAAVGDEPYTALWTTAFVGGGYVGLTLIGAISRRSRSSRYRAREEIFPRTRVTTPPPQSCYLFDERTDFTPHA